MKHCSRRGLSEIGAKLFLLLIMLPLTALQAASDPFPVPPALNGPVAFWRDVFSLWTLNQVALHDREYPNLVYEVVQLPGRAGESYTATQKAHLREREQQMTARIERATRKSIAGARLSPAEAALVERIRVHAGVSALRDAASRLRAQRGLRERFRDGLGIAQRYDKAFREIFRNAGLPEDLAYLPHVESSFRNRAVSSVGAAGIWQFMPATGRRYMIINTALDERLDPLIAAQGAARYLGEAYAALGDWALAVTSYNHGIQGMRRAKARFGTDFARIVRQYDARSFGFASRNFYAEFLAARAVASQIQRYFPEGISAPARLPARQWVLDRPTTPRTLAQRYGVSVTELAAINNAWTKAAVRRNLKLPVGTRIWLPDGASTVIAAVTAEETSGDAAEPPAPTRKPAYYKVRPRDTLSAIARRHGLTLAELRKLNRMKPRHSVIRSGQRLRVSQNW